MLPAVNSISRCGKNPVLISERIMNGSSVRDEESAPGFPVDIGTIVAIAELNSDAALEFGDGILRLNFEDVG